MGQGGSENKDYGNQVSAMVQALYNDKNNPIAEICKTLNISRATLYRYIQKGERQEQAASQKD